jgi:hypothetical protein
MGSGWKRRTKKHRRAMKAILKFGNNAKRSHKKLSGRTGGIRSHRLKEKSV